MSTLIRLFNDRDQSEQIRNNISDQFILKPYSKVSLTDLNVRFSNREDIIQEKFFTKGEKIEIITKVFPTGTFVNTVELEQDFNSFNDFINGLRDALNSKQVNISPFAGGQDWQVETDSANKVSLEFGLVNRIPFNFTSGLLDNWSTVGINKLLAAGDRTAGYTSTKVLSRSNFKVGVLKPAKYVLTSSDLKIGFLEKTEDFGASSFLGLFVPGSSSANYQLLALNTPIQDLGVVPQDGDLISFLYKNQGDSGQISVFVQDEDGNNKASVIDATVPYPNATFKLAVENLGNGSPTDKGGITTKNDSDDDAVLTEIDDDNFSARTVSIKLTPKIQQYLGFKDSLITSTSKKGQRVIFAGTEQSKGNKTSKGILVTLEGVGQLSSFDGLSGKITETLCVIPDTARLNGTRDLIHSPNYKYQLMLKNTEPLRVNQLIVRFYTNLDDKPLLVDSGSIVSLIFDS